MVLQTGRLVGNKSGFVRSRLRWMKVQLGITKQSRVRPISPIIPFFDGFISTIIDFSSMGFPSKNSGF